MDVDATILTENEMLYFPHGNSNLDGNSRVGGQQDSKLTTCPEHWKDLDVNGCKSAYYIHCTSESVEKTYPEIY